MFSIKVYRINHKGDGSNKVGRTIYSRYTKKEIENTLLKDGWKRDLHGYIKDGFYLSVQEIVPTQDLIRSLLFIET